MEKKKTKKILKKHLDKWMTENDGMMKDYIELCEKLLMFRVMWGVEIGIIFKNADLIEQK